MKKIDCVGLGIIALDHLITVEQYPESNSKNIITSHKQQGGGPVPTALAVLGTFGCSVSLITKMGKDAPATFLTQELMQYHIDVSHIIQNKTIDTPEAFIIVENKSGDRTVLLHRSKAADLLPTEVPTALLKKCRILHLDGHEAEAAMYAAKLAHDYQALVSIDIGSDRFIPAELLQLVDIAIVCESFANAQLVKNNALKSVEKLLSFGPKIAGVTCGERGSYFADEQFTFHQPALPVKVVDSTGAGDVFHGAFLFGLLQGFSLRETAVFASATAALACTKLGGKSGIPTIGDVIELLKKNRYTTDFINGG